MLQPPSTSVTPKVNGGAVPVGPSLPGTGGPSDARQAAFQQSLQGLVGKSMPAEVLAHLTDGNFLVKVAGTSVRMPLPAGTPVGSQLPLTLIAANPRPTFQAGAGPGRNAAAPLLYAQADDGSGAAALAATAGRAGAAATPNLSAQAAALAAAEAKAGQQAPAGTAAGRTDLRPQSLAASLLGKAPLTSSADLPGFDPSAPAPSLSQAARMIAGVLSQANNGAEAPRAIVGKGPLAADGPIDAAQLAQKLQQTLGQSGLFYESHVAEWADGQRSLPDLTHEPQMQQAPRPPGASGPDLASAQMINLQLNTHEQARVQWRGEAWAGLPMEWDVRKEQQQGGRRGDDGTPPQPSWRSGLRLQFPQLGAVSATVVLVNGQVHIQMQAGTADAADALRSHAGRLQGALDAAGAPLSSLNIGLDPAAQGNGNGAGDDGGGSDGR